MKTNNDAEEIKALLNRLHEFANTFEVFKTFESTAQRMLFARSATAFHAAEILCREGLFVDAYNSTRIGLEAGWLALSLRQNEDFAREWLTLVPRDTNDTDIEKKYRNTFGNLTWIRKTLSLNKEELCEKTNLYQLLSTKSHANPAAMVYFGSNNNGIDSLILYPSEPLHSEVHKAKFIAGILYCLKYLLHDIQRHCVIDLNVNWKYDEMKLFNIAGIAFPDQNGNIKVVPDKVNSAYQAQLLLEIAHQQAKNMPGQSE